MAASAECRLIDTACFEAFLAQKDALPKRYDGLTGRFDEAVGALLAGWQGEGADAFAADAAVVRQGMTDIGETVALLCATVADIRELLGEADHRLGQANRQAI